VAAESRADPDRLGREHVKIDTALAHPARVMTAHPARVSDYWLGGTDNYPADREAAEQAIAAYPGIIPAARANRAFLREAVHYLAAQAGVRQFLDIGTGIPAMGSVHEAARQAAPAARVVYVDNDPVVLAHARALLARVPADAVVYLSGDLRDPDMIVQEAAATLDFSRPVAVTLLMILQLILDDEDPYAIVGRLAQALPSGSYLAISHPASDIQAAAMAEMARRLSERSGPYDQVAFRTHAEVGRFFDGLEPVEPGMMPMRQWLAGKGGPGPGHEIAAYCGIARIRDK
jgi:hypothetical protein